jgi:predicted amidohydrolase
MMQVALLQVASPDDESVAQRVDRVSRLVLGEARLRGVDLLVLPELWNVGYFSFDEYPARAEPLAGPTISAVRDWAVALGTRIHAGSIVEVDADGRLHNTSVVVGPDGTIENVYRKQQLLTPGASVATSPVATLPTGITTCYDLRFPELYRSLVDAGAELVAVCAAWPAARLAHWQLFTSVRAVEQQIWLIACNAVGDQAGIALGGHSRIVNPRGELIIEAEADEGFTYADLDPSLPRQVRSEFPALADRRWPPTPQAAAP